MKASVVSFSSSCFGLVMVILQAVVCGALNCISVILRILSQTLNH